MTPNATRPGARAAHVPPYEQEVDDRRHVRHTVAVLVSADEAETARIVEAYKTIAQVSDDRVARRRGAVDWVQ